MNSCSVLMTLVNLNDCIQVTDKGVQALARCEQLRKIELRNTQVSDTGARALADWCDNLRQIDLNGTTVTPEAMQYMRLKLPRLTFKVSKCTSMMCVCRAGGAREYDAQSSHPPPSFSLHHPPSSQRAPLGGLNHCTSRGSSSYTRCARDLRWVSHVGLAAWVLGMIHPRDLCAIDAPVRVSDVGRPQPRTSHHDTTAATQRHYQRPYHRGTSREVAGGPAQAVDGTPSTAPVNVASTAGA